MHLRSPALIVFVTAAALALLAASSVGSEAKGEIKATGCLQQGDEPGEFMLTSEGGKSYELIPGGKASLKEHLGHQVEVTGSESSEAAEEKYEEGKSSAKKGEAREEKERAHEHLKVSSIRHIADTCK
jgi:hypothetical protein